MRGQKMPLIFIFSGILAFIFHNPLDPDLHSVYIIFFTFSKYTFIMRTPLTNPLGDKSTALF